MRYVSCNYSEVEGGLCKVKRLYVDVDNKNKMKTKYIKLKVWMSMLERGYFLPYKQNTYISYIK